jgi:hypothetical protein
MTLKVMQNYTVNGSNRMWSDQLVERLPSKHEALNSNPSTATTKKKVNTMVELSFLFNI